MSVVQEQTVDLARRVHSIVREYVYRKTDARTNMKRADFPEIVDPNTGRRRRQIPQDYLAAQRKVCEDAFLTMRSRRSRQDFVEYFTATICAVPHFLPDREYQALAVELLADDGWERVKALAMLALSSVWPS